MKKNSFLTTLIFVILTSLSCNEELIDEGISNDSGIIKNVEIKNNRMYFSNKESIQHYFQLYADETDDKLANFMNNYYEKGFISLIPIATEENERLVYDQIIKREAKLQSDNVSRTESDQDIAENIDDLEEIIGSETFAAFLNDEAEVQVGTKIYKYTDCGLFIVDEDKYVELEQYLDDQNISDNLLESTDEVVAENYIESSERGVVYHRTTDIEHYMAALESPESYGGTVGGGGSSNPAQPVAPPDMQTFINNLPVCSDTSGLFGSLFGDNHVCIDRYENRRRVKTKAWNLNFFLVYHVGVKVKHQYKGWTGIWRSEQTAEVGMGVTYAQFTYDYDPMINNAVAGTANYWHFLTSNNIKYAFAYNESIGNYPYNMTNVPPLFRDDIVIEKFRTGFTPFDDVINQAISLGNKQLTSENLNKQFWQQIWDQVNSILSNFNQSTSISPNRTLISKPVSPSQLLVQKSLRNHGTNIAVREKTFDWGVEFQIGINPNTGNISTNFGNPNSGIGVIIRPKNYKVSMYGVARNYDGSLHGSRLVF